MKLTTLDLNGVWSLQKNAKGEKIPASVPGDVYADLLTAGKIPDPFYRDNEFDLQWIGESNWKYSRTFKVSKELLSKKNIFLRCEGLDTFATVTINNHLIAETDNMFRSYEWDLFPVLKAGKNTISIDFTSVLPYIGEQTKKFPEWTCDEYKVAYPGWVRKEQCNFGWDWGIKALSCGIWKSIQIVAFDEGRLTDVHVKQHHRVDQVDLDIDVSTEKSRKGTLVAVTVLDGQTIVTKESTKVSGNKTCTSLTITKPKLWWPNNMGDQHLYTVKVELRNSDGDLVDAMEKRVGLRTLVLDRHDDEWGESFQFVVNGVPFFSKGANWIPVDAVLARRKPEKYRRLVEDAATCNMNMLRVWGGGIYEDYSFYDACDELGICVWQDFMFACASYPTFQKGFLANVKTEARDAIKRLRHHPCMALWCGNNELEMMNVGGDDWSDGKMPWKAYKELFDDLLPKQVAELSPDIDYWPSSPHSPKGDRSQHRSHRSGDAHLWIMSGRYPLECAKGMEHRFASEFGFQSFPEPKTIATFTESGDHNISSQIMELHQRAPNGNTTIIQQLLRCFRLPEGFENTLWVSQILQGTGVKGTCEHFRRAMPQAMGALYWQLNDCWPVASWSSIDYHGNWKAMHYMAKHFFAPVLISGVEDCEKNTVDIHLTSDRMKSLETLVSWTVTDVQGKILENGCKKARTPISGSIIVKTLRLQKLVEAYKANNLLIWIEADIEGEPGQRNIVFLAPPKHMELNPNPGIHHRINRNKDGSFNVTITSRKVALWNWIELDGIDAKLSNNFFHLRPGLTEDIYVKPDRKLTLNQFKRSLMIKSLVDTYIN